MKAIFLQTLLCLFLAPTTWAQVPVTTPSPAPTVVAADPMSFLDNKINLSYGDVINYRVAEDRDETKKLIVMESGEINIPYYGPAKAVGKTPLQFATEVKELLEKNLYHRATVIISIEETRKGRVFVVGAVGRPGPVDLSPIEKLTVSKAILAAGGFAPFGNKGKVKLIRKTGEGPKDKKEFTLDVGAVLEKGQLEKDMDVVGGDMIIVSEKLINF